MRVLITGSTGMIGKGVLLECLDSDVISEVIVVNRTPLKMTHPKLQEILCKDWQYFSDIQDHLHNIDACFFCLGATATTLSEAQFKAVTYDLTLNLASQLSKNNKNMVLTYVSGMGTDDKKPSKVMWIRIKGETEKALLELPIKGAYMFRPGYIMPLRGAKSKTLIYRLFYILSTPFYPLIRKFVPHATTSTVEIGKAMIAIAKEGYHTPYIENDDINALAKKDLSPSGDIYAEPDPWSLVSQGYAETTMDYLACFAKDALTHVPLNTESRIVDVACGPGTVARLIEGEFKWMDALDFSDQMIDLHTAYIEEKNIQNVKAIVGDGQQLPYSDNAYDLALSMFGLMFFPDREKGFKELYRVLKPGGMAVVTSWASVDQSPAFNLMFGAIQHANPTTPQPEKMAETLEDPVQFEKELKQAGFTDIQIIPSIQSVDVPTVEELWAFVEKGMAPLVVLKEKLTEEEWQQFKKKALAYVKDKVAKEGLSCDAKAWIGIGKK